VFEHPEHRWIDATDSSRVQRQRPWLGVWGKAPEDESYLATVHR